MEVRDIPIERIDRGERFREDLGDLTTLIDSIREKGLLQPISVCPHPSDPSRYLLLAGERRLTACQRAGLDAIPALVREYRGEIDRREIELIENLHRKEMHWTEQAALTAELHRLYQEKHGAEWTQRRLAALLGRSLGDVNQDLQLANALEAVPELGQAKGKKEALTVLKRLEESATIAERKEKVLAEAAEFDMLEIASDNYRVGDAVAGLEELARSGYKGARLYEVDPPYAVAIDRVKTQKGSVQPVGLSEYHEVSATELQTLLGKVLALAYEASQPDAWLILWYASRNEVLIRAILEASPWSYHPIPAIWVKEKGVCLNPPTVLASCYEPFFICRKGNAQIVRQGRSNVFQYPIGDPKKRRHPTEKPLDLMRDLLTTFAHPGDTVVCPFLGSGNTLLACYHEGMYGMGWDLEEAHKVRFLEAVREQFPRGGTSDA